MQRLLRQPGQDGPLRPRATGPGDQPSTRPSAADGLRYTPGSIEVRHLLEVLIDDVGLDELGTHVTRPLHGLRVAPYLGCLVSRPDYDERWQHREHPLELDRLLLTLGAEVVDYPLRTDCCGGHMTQISPDTGLELIRRLIDGAERSGADVLVTVCPMCQMNVDVYQGEMNHHFRENYHMPILFFTQLIGLAFGLEPREPRHRARGRSRRGRPSAGSASRCR